MVGFESKWDLTREVIMLTLGVVDEASATVLGLEGRRPRRPLRLSVRTTKGGREETFRELNFTLKTVLRLFFCCTYTFSQYVITLPSLTIPTARHFWKRQNWQRFLLLLSTGQSLLARHTYLAFFCTVRCQMRMKNYITKGFKWLWTHKLTNYK